MPGLSYQQQKQVALQWKAAAPLLRAQRHRDIRLQNNAQSIEVLHLSCRRAIKKKSPSMTSGFITMYRILKPTSADDCRVRYLFPAYHKMTVKHMQCCEIYFRSGCLYVVSQSFSELGVGISVGPIFKADPNSWEEVGTAVNAALDASKKGIPHPKDKAEMELIRSRIFSTADVKSWREFIKNVKHVSVDRIDPGVRITLNETVKGGGFVPTGKRVDISAENVIGIGIGVLQVLGLHGDPVALS